MSGVIERPDGFEVRSHEHVPLDPGESDLDRIQQAVDSVGKAPKNKIFLKGTFDLGDGTLILRKDVRILGEKPIEREDDGRGVKVGTTFRGGGSGMPPCAIQWGNPVQITASIEDIRFEGFRGDGIRVYRTTGDNVIRGCSFVDYVPVPIVPWQAGMMFLACPIVVEPEGSPDDLAGSLRIEDCSIHEPLVNFNAEENPINNILHFGNCNLNLEIRNNALRGMYWLPIAVWGNKGNTTIAGNLIEKTNSYWRDGAAISFGLTTEQFFRADAFDGTALIDDNEIHVKSLSTYGISVCLYSDKQNTAIQKGLLSTKKPKITVSNNHLTMEGPNERAALACIGACSESTWEANTITGTSRYGILITRSMPEPSARIGSNGAPRDNEFRKNDLSGFTASETQAYIDPESERCTLDRNSFGPLAGVQVATTAGNRGRAGISCHGTDCELMRNDFGDSGLAGWSKTPSEGAIHLYPESARNSVTWQPADFPATSTNLPDDQIRDEGTQNAIRVKPGSAHADIGAVPIPV